MAVFQDGSLFSSVRACGDALVLQGEVNIHLLRCEHLDELCQLAVRHFDDLNNARRDLGHPHAAWVTSGEEDLNGSGAGHMRASTFGQTSSVE